jgi:MOSC domain-containing protein YiiM
MTTMFEGEVVSIHIAEAEGDDVYEVAQVQAVPGRGLEGDRYFYKSGSFARKWNPGREVTLVESEAIEALARDYGIELGPGETRRNITTRGVPLNHLVGKRFRVGETVLRGERLCHPCSLLESMTKPGVRKGLTHRGGLNAAIVSAGAIRKGDRICSDAGSA